MIRTRVALFRGEMQRVFAGQEYDLSAETSRQFIMDGTAYDAQEVATQTQFKPGKVRKNGLSKTRNRRIS